MQDEREAINPLLTIFQSIVVSKFAWIVTSITTLGGIGTYNREKITQILNSLINASKESRKRLTQANMKMVTTVFSNGFSFAKDLSKFSSQLDAEVKQAEEGSEKRADLEAEKSTVDTIVKATKEDSLDQYSEDELQILAGIDESKTWREQVLNDQPRRGMSLRKRQGEAFKKFENVTMLIKITMKGSLQSKGLQSQTKINPVEADGSKTKGETRKKI